MILCVFREKEAWEASDGALHLMEQLLVSSPKQPGDVHATPSRHYQAVAAGALVDAVCALLPSLPDLAELRSFRKAPALRETLWKCLPGVAQVGRRTVKGSPLSRSSLAVYLSFILCTTLPRPCVGCAEAAIQAVPGAAACAHAV